MNQQTISRSIRISAILCLNLILGFFVVPGVRAQGSVTFGLEPYSLAEQRLLPRLDYVLSPGEEKSDAVLVTNPSDEVHTLHLFLADAHTSTTGGVVFPDSAELPISTGKWLTLSSSEVTLQPQEQRVVSFTLKVPADALPGEHRAGIVLELANPDDAPASSGSGDNIQVTMLYRSALNLRVTVPGPTNLDFRIESVVHRFESNESSFIVAMRNAGNVAVDVIGGQLSVLDDSGRVIGSQPINLTGKFLAADGVEAPILFDEPLPPGRYVASVQVEYKEGGPAAGEFDVEISATDADQAAQEVVDRGFALTGQPAAKPSAPNYGLYVIVGAGALLLLVIGVIVGVRMARQRSK